MKSPMRIISTLPTATEILFELGLGESVVGVSHECNYPASAASLPQVTTVNFDFTRSPSAKIDAHVKSTIHAGRSLYRLNDDLLQALQPTHIITQELCEVCAITPNDIQKSIRGLTSPPVVISLKSQSLADIRADIIRLADALHAKTAAAHLVSKLSTTLAHYRSQTRSLPQRTVFCAEWLDPLFATGHWVPNMIRIAGGRDIIARSGQASRETTWQHVAKLQPEVLILIPCGFPIAKTLSELPQLRALPEWQSLQAVQNDQVWAADGPAYFSQSGPRVISEGIPLLASIIHPEIFGLPKSTQAIKI